MQKGFYWMAFLEQSIAEALNEIMSELDRDIDAVIKNP